MTTTHNEQAEENVLGAMMMAPRAVLACIDEGLQPDDFYYPSHATICRAIFALDERGEEPDPITVIAELEKRGDLERAGGKPSVNTLASVVSSTHNAPQYARIVREAATVRRLKRAGQEILDIASGEGEPSEKISAAEEALAGAAERAQVGEVLTIGAGMGEAIAEITEAFETGVERSGLKTGFTLIDRMTHGLFPGQMVVLAARPGQGKSTLAQNVAENVAQKGIGVCIFSLEMSQQEIGLRMISSLGSISHSDLQTGKLTAHDHQRMLDTHAKLTELPIYVADTEEVSMPGLRAQVRRLKRQKDIGLLIVDYLQLMLSGKSSENRNVEVSMISRGLKMLARELEIPVLAVAQLSREVERRSDKRPLLSDLRDSGSIEQDADVVAFIYRDEYYNDASDSKGEAEVIIAKQRSGVTGKAKLAFLGHRCKFANLANDQDVAVAATEADLPF